MGERGATRKRPQRIRPTTSSSVVARVCNETFLSREFAMLLWVAFEGVIAVG
jgi:hypothetical protein